MRRSEREVVKLRRSDWIESVCRNNAESWHPLTSNVQKYVDEIAKDVGDAAELEQYSGEVRNLLRTRRDLLLQVGNSYGVYLRVLGSIDIEQRRLLDSMERYQQFLAKNLLWIPSAQVIGVGLVETGLPD